LAYPGSNCKLLSFYFKKNYIAQQKKQSSRATMVGKKGREEVEKLREQVRSRPLLVPDNSRRNCKLLLTDFNAFNSIMGAMSEVNMHWVRSPTKGDRCVKSFGNGQQGNKI